MQLLRLVRVSVLGFGFGFGCGGGARPAPARVAHDAAVVPGPATALCKAPPAGTTPLVLPASVASHDLTLDVDRPGGVEPEDWKGKMTVDGVVTATMWPLQAPQQYRLADGRYLLNDTYNANLLMLWDPATKTLTELARGVLMPVSARGAMVYTAPSLDGGASGAFSTIDPAAPRLREIWRFERATSDTGLVGAIDGVPALIVRPPVSAATATAAEPTPVTILCLGSAGVTGRFDAVVPAGFHAVGVDPVDGHRLLLLGTVDPAPPFMGVDDGLGAGPPSFDAEVAVLDLVSGTVRSLGRAVGGWTQTTAVPHPVLRVAWDDGTHERSPAYALAPDGAITLVDPTTERLVSGAR